MIWVDYLILSIICMSTILSIIRGVIREILYLLTWASAIAVASNYYSWLAVYFTRFDAPIVRNSIAISILFITTWVIGTIINDMITLLAVRTGIWFINRFNHLLGIVFGLLRGILIVCVMIFLLNVFTHVSNSYYWQNSVLIPPFYKIIQLGSHLFVRLFFHNDQFI